MSQLNIIIFTLSYMVVGLLAITGATIILDDKLLGAVSGLSLMALLAVSLMKMVIDSD